MIAFGDFMPLKLVTPGHIWSQVFKLVTVEVKNPYRDSPRILYRDRQMSWHMVW